MPGRILFVTWDGGGNVPPVLALGARLQARGHEVSAPRQRVARASLRRCRDRLHGPDAIRSGTARRLARDVAAAAADADVVVADYMQPAALVGAEAADRPVVALVHTLYAANLDGSGGLLPMQMAASVEGVSGLAESLGLALCRLVRRPARPLPHGAGDQPRGAGPAGCPTGRQRALRRTGPRGRGPGCRLAAGRTLRTVVRSWQWASGRPRWTRRPWCSACSTRSPTRPCE